jgi:hypothetical protein
MFNAKQKNAIAAAGNADKALGHASEIYQSRLVDMSKLFKSSDLVGKYKDTPQGKYRLDALKVLAATLLSKEDLAVYNSDGPANPMVNGKRQKTEKGDIQNRVSQCLARIVEGLRKIENGATPKGAKNNAPRDMNSRIREEVGKLYKAVATDKDSESPALVADHKEMLAAFQRVLDLVPEKKVTPKH